MLSLFWILLAFFCGALPMSVWVGRLALGVDIRQYGDGNPGATNVFRAGGKGWGIAALLLDFFKGVLPVALAQFIAGIDGWPLILVALAPILGHAYSPFLGGQGGKALAVTFGIWTGLTLFIIPLILGLLFALWLYLLKPEGWAVLASSLCLLLALLLMGSPAVWLGTCLGMTLTLGLSHRHDLQQRPVLRPFRRPPAIS